MKEKAEGVLEKLTSTGLEFSKGRMNLNLQAEEGKPLLLIPINGRSVVTDT